MQPHTHRPLDVFYGKRGSGDSTKAQHQVVPRHIKIMRIVCTECFTWLCLSAHKAYMASILRMMFGLITPDTLYLPLFKVIVMSFCGTVQLYSGLRW